MWWSKKETAPAVKPEAIIKKKSAKKRNSLDASEATLLNTAETGSGFEVHFVKENDPGRDDRRSDKATVGREISGMMKSEPSNETSVACRLLSVKKLMEGRRKVHRSQYASYDRNTHETSLFDEPFLDNFVPRAHRVPLAGNVQSTVKPSKIKESLLLLQQYDVSSELRCLEEEIKLMDMEIVNLKKDKADMEVYSKLVPLQTNHHITNGISSTIIDAHRLLLGGAPKLSSAEKKELQEKRGTCLTLRLSDDKCREFLFSKCGFKTSFFSQFIPNTQSSSTMTLSKENCGDEGPAASIQHISILSDDSVLISLDSDKSLHHGRLPERLYRRLQPDQNINQNHLHYVATGPLGCYYAEFRSGKVIWGIASDSSEGDDFATLCRDWNVSRVAFGPFCVVHDSHGIAHKAASWVILSSDGRAAWKNVPSRLHRLLEDRLASQAAPVEVSLGYGDSYFVRFLDGSVDYCLPAHLAAVIEEGKLDVTSISLHPDLPYDFVIRHR